MLKGMPVLDVVSDVVCPWCYIGKKRLEKALVLLGEGDWEVHWKPFQLNPGAPKEGMDRQEYRVRKFGSLAVSRQLEDRVTAAGEQDGISFHFDRIKRTPNTFDAHRLIWLAGREGKQDEVVESLFQAYFLNGEDIGDAEVLNRIAGENGVDAEQLFTAGLGRSEVAAEEEKARQVGVSGVPAFLLNGAPVTSGAHPAGLLAQMFRDFRG